MRKLLSLLLLSVFCSCLFAADELVPQPLLEKGLIPIKEGPAGKDGRIQEIIAADSSITVDSADPAKPKLKSTSAPAPDEPARTQIKAIQNTPNYNDAPPVTLTATKSHINDKNNPHAVNKAQIGLGSCDNTSDASKPVSIATQKALDDKVSKAALDAYKIKDAVSGQNTTVIVKDGVLKVDATGGGVQEIIAADSSITVDSADPAKPKIKANSAPAPDEPARTQIKAIKGTVNYNDPSPITLTDAKSSLVSLTAAITNKANIGDSYLKAEEDGKLALKADKTALDIYKIKDAVNGANTTVSITNGVLRVDATGGGGDSAIEITEYTARLTKGAVWEVGDAKYDGYHCSVTVLEEQMDGLDAWRQCIIGNSKNTASEYSVNWITAETKDRPGVILPYLQVTRLCNYEGDTKNVKIFVYRKVK